MSGEGFRLDQAFIKAREAIQPYIMPPPDHPEDDFPELLQRYIEFWEEEVYRATTLRWGSYDLTQIANWILPKSFDEWQKRLKQPGFYAANARALAYILRKSGGLLERLEGQEEDDLIELSRQLVWDAERMLSMLGRHYLGLSTNLGLTARSNVAKPPDLVGVWEFLAFGTSHATLPPFSRLPASVAVLRMALEIYMKQCFGIVYIRKSKSNEPVVLGLEKIFTSLKELKRQYPDEVASEIGIHTLCRINKWANITMHSGIDMFFWTTLWAGRLLTQQVVRRHPAFSGVRVINFGLRLSHRAYEEGRAKIVQRASELCEEPVEIVDIQPCSEII